MRIIIYGANGYSARLMLEKLRDFELHPVLAGRSANKIRPLAEEYNLKYQVFSLSDSLAIRSNLEGCNLLINCAGPFNQTAVPLVRACLDTSCHYVDITGEIDVFESLKKFDKKAREAGIMILPGIGFDVVPTDCMAARIFSQVANPSELNLAFMTVGGGISHGTASTAVQKLGYLGAERKDGKIIEVPIGHRHLMVNFGKKRQFTISIPWGDVSTAHVTTGIPNIRTFTRVPKKIYYLLKWQRLFNPLLRSVWIKKIIQTYLDKKVEGPTKDQRESGKAIIWGQVRNPSGSIAEGRLEVAETYTFTAYSALLVAEKISKGKWSSGYQTPAKIYGPDLVSEIPGTVWK